MSTLDARGLRIERGGRTLVDGFDLTVGPGETVAVTGPSGSGKTSLLAALSGLTPPEAGRVTVGGEPVATHELGVVLQGYGLVSLLTASENVEVALRAKGHEPSESRESAAAALDEVGLAEQVDHLVEELSGGQQQRVAVARALAIHPDILIADEPTAEQDEATRGKVLERLFAVADRGGTLILATHDPLVAERCDVQIRIG